MARARSRPEFIELGSLPQTTADCVQSFLLSAAQHPGDKNGTLRDFCSQLGGRFALDCEARGQPRKWEFLMEHVRDLERRGMSREAAASRIARNHDPANAKTIRQALINYD